MAYQIVGGVLIGMGIGIMLMVVVITFVEWLETR